MAQLFLARVPRLLVLCLLVVGSLVVAQQENTAAVPCQAVIQNYFSDSNCTNWVGARYTLCEGMDFEGSFGCWRRSEYLECCYSCGGCQGPGVGECMPRTAPECP